MTDRTTFETIADGDYLAKGYYNGIYNTSKIQEVYTGTDLDFLNATTGTTTTSYEMATISSDSLISANYLEISILAQTYVRSWDDGNTGSATISYKLEIKEIGGSYSTIGTFAINNMIGYSSNPGVTNITPIFRYLYELTSGEKINGCQLKISGISSVSFSGYCSLTNNQVVLKLKN